MVYFSRTSLFDWGVSAYVATAYDIARSSRYKADNDFLVSWWGSETQMKLFYEFERRKELVVVL